jgi:RHS repeat-associated protein
VNFSYYGTSGDERLQQIQNLNSSSGVISQFNYGYDADGDITSWQQANSALSGTNSFAVNYDAANQLSWATLTAGTASVTSYSYGYDQAGNRTQNQIDSAATTSSYNNLNQLVAQSPGGLTEFRGSLSKWGTVTVAGNPATVTGTTGSYQFAGAASLTTGTNTVAIVATGTSGVSGTNSYQVVVSATGSAVSPSYDADGEMTGNGAGQSYQWDAANRLAKIWYGPVGSGSSTTFSYNGLSQRVGIVETSSTGTVTSTKQFVWLPGNAQPSEERDASDNVIRRLYAQGEQISGTNYYYTRDHLGSVRELTNASGAVQARYSYDLWGNQTKLSGTVDSEFGYAGYYQHLPSGLNLTMYRAYSGNLGRWLSRDPSGEAGGINLYGYVGNNPTAFVDLLGLCYPKTFIGLLPKGECYCNDGEGGGGNGGGGGDNGGGGGGGGGGSFNPNPQGGAGGNIPGGGSPIPPGAIPNPSQMLGNLSGQIVGAGIGAEFGGLPGADLGATIGGGIGENLQNIASGIGSAIDGAEDQIGHYSIPQGDNNNGFSAPTNLPPGYVDPGSNGVGKHY